MLLYLFLSAILILLIFLVLFKKRICRHAFVPRKVADIYPTWVCEKCGKIEKR